MQIIIKKLIGKKTITIDIDIEDNIECIKKKFKKKKKLPFN